MDHLDVYKRLSQPVDERKLGVLGILKPVVGDVSAIQGMEHLQGIRELAESVWLTGNRNTKERIILLCSRPELAKQAAMAYETLLIGLPYEDETKGKEEENVITAPGPLLQSCSEEADDYEDEDDEADEEDEDGYWDNPGEDYKRENENEGRKLDFSRDYLCLTLDQLSPGYNENPSSMQQMQMFQAQDQEAKVQMVMKKASKLFLDVFHGTMTDGLIDRIAEDSDQVKTIVIAMPDRTGNDYFLKRLSFEQGFEILTVEDPRDDHYRDLITSYLQARELRLKDMTADDILQRIQRYRKGLFEEKDLIRYIDLAQKHASSGELEIKDFCLYRETEEGQGIHKLECLIGLEDVKRTIKGLQAICIEDLKKEKHSPMHTNLAFAGNPGTGKSVVAKLYGEILSDIGLSNGRFVSAGRQDMIGQYVGHTAPMISDLFRRARGGVLFIDEAGFLLQRDVFTGEAVTELIRYMEEQPETTVIFASYPDKIQQLLQSDHGFSSRIRRVLTFPDYSQGELLMIMEMMAKEQELQLTKGSCKIALAYLRNLKAERVERFGNAREVRKLLENAYEQYCLRSVYGSCAQEIRDRVITENDMQLAVQHLMPGKPAEKQKVGFIYPKVFITS